MPPILPLLDTTMSDHAAARAKEWRDFDAAQEHAALVPTAVGDRTWFAAQLVVLLDSLSQGAPLRISTLNALDAAYGLSVSRNSEIHFRWLQLALASNHVGTFPLVVKFLLSQGRMKFTRPLYRALFKSAGKELAVATFKKNKDFYHPICARLVAKDLGLE